MIVLMRVAMKLLKEIAYKSVLGVCLCGAYAVSSVVLVFGYLLCKVRDLTGMNDYL